MSTSLCVQMHKFYFIWFQRQPLVISEQLSQFTAVYICRSTLCGLAPPNEKNQTALRSIPKCDKISAFNSHGNVPLVISTACLCPCSSIVITTATAKNKGTYQFCTSNVSGIRIPVDTVLGFWPTLVQKIIPKIIKRTIYTLQMLNHHCRPENNGAEFNFMYVFALYAMQTGLLTIK